MKKILLLTSLTALQVFAHPGHPGPVSHGDATHLMLGLLAALPLLAATAWILRSRNLRRAPVAVRKDKTHG